MCGSNYRAARQAFTLIELLTVIAVVGILAAILVPAIGKVRSNALTTECVSNLRQIGIGMQLYAQDNDGILPAPRSSDNVMWQMAISPYMQGREDANTNQLTKVN